MPRVSFVNASVVAVNLPWVASRDEVTCTLKVCKDSRMGQMATSTIAVILANAAEKISSSIDSDASA